MDTNIQFRTDTAYKKKVTAKAKKYAKLRGRPSRGALSDFIRDAIEEKIQKDGL